MVEEYSIGRGAEGCESVCPLTVEAKEGRFNLARSSAGTYMKLVLPKAAIPDVKVLATLSLLQLRQLKAIYEGSVGKQDQDVARIAKMLSLEATEARSVQMVVEFAMSLAQDLGAQNVAEEFATLLERNGERAASDNLRANLDQLLSVFTPSSKRKNAEKVNYLAHGPVKTVDNFRTVCEIRPIFGDGKPDSDSIRGHVCVVMLVAETSDLEGNKETTTLTMTQESLSDLEACIRRARLKLSAMEAKYGKEVSIDGA